MKKRIITKIIIIIILIIGIVIALLLNEKQKNNNTNSNNNSSNNKHVDIDTTNLGFDYKFVRRVSSTHQENFMISPMSIAYALSILKEGASDNTKKEIENVLGNYKLSSVINIKDRIGLANALFIKKDFDVKDEYINLLKTTYNSDVIIDKFTTPEPINNWVKQKTFNMIEKVVDNLDPMFKVGIANALAIDVEWKNKFECTSTIKDQFNLTDGTKMDTPFMNSKNDVAYFETSNAKGIVKDYLKYNYKTGKPSYDDNDADTISLEYIAILPNNIDEYLKSFNENELNNILNNLKTADSKTDIYLSLPKYTYDFNYNDFKSSLIDLGMKDAFDGINAKFDKISDIPLYVSEAIHKSHIELSEEGTKAAAVTLFLMRDNAMEPMQKEKIEIKFDKPFVYIIKEKNNNNIWFFGTVYKPLEFSKNTKCEVK